MKFVFNIEPADRSVGIMSESFAGWMEDAPHHGYWCELVEYTTDFKSAKFQDNDISKDRRMNLSFEEQKKFILLFKEHYSDWLFTNYGLVE